MAEIATSKTINVYQLRGEIGVPTLCQTLGVNAEGVIRLRVHGCTQPALEAAVAAHVADPTIVAPDASVTRQAIIEAALTALANNRAFVAAPKPSTAAGQAGAAYDAAVRHARQINAVIRLLLGALDSPD